MKRISIIFILDFVLTVIFLFSQFSCKHEAPISCEAVGFKITAIQTDAVLSNSNGTITVTAEGGTGFKYCLNGGNYVDTGFFAGLAPFNTYVITGKNSIGCTDTVEIIIGSTDPCKGVTIGVTATKIDASPNQSNGSITATASGGAGYTYSIGNAFQTNGTFSGLTAGNYTVAAKSSTGCMGTTQVTIGTNDPCAGVTVAITTTLVQPGVNLSNGSITAAATGGTGFTYSLNGGTFQASGTFSGLATGNYSITAKNSNGCTGTTQVALGANNPCTGVTVLVTTTQVNPAGGQSNGNITASATGGTGFTYSLNNGAYQASGIFSNLAAGPYTITAKNSNGCLGTTQVTLTATSLCTAVITITPTIVNLTPCSTPANNGSITVSAAGSTGFTYNINGGTYQASNAFLNLASGNYLVGVKDVNGCTKSLTVTVGIIPPGPTFAAVRTLITNRCSGSGCHINGGSAAGYNFDSDCSILTNWSKINQATVLYTLKKMPISPQATFTAAEKQMVTDWINAGHLYNK
jgi:hypothetical protein